MEKIVSVETMRKSDAWTIEHLIPSKELMFRAGKAIYEAAKWKAPVAVVCGKGNNAGDGYVVADLLHKAGTECVIFLLSDRFSEDGRIIMIFAWRMASHRKGLRNPRIFPLSDLFWTAFWEPGFRERCRD